MTRRLLPLVLGVVLLSAGTAAATTIDLTTADATGEINDALFIQGATLSGTGRFPAFVQVTGNDPIHDAYNTTVNGTNDNGAANPFNHAITLATIPHYEVGGIEYYSFFLDINEEDNADDRYLSLDNVIIWTSTVPNQSTEPYPTDSVTLRYEMDAGADSIVLLNYTLEPGSGRADMELLVPVNFFAGALPGDYVYLYSIFGGFGVYSGALFPTGNYGAGDGFEEWARGQGTFDEIPPPPPPDIDSVPEPATLLLVGSGLAAAAAARRRQSRKV